MKIEEHFGEHLDIDIWKWEAMLVYLSIFILFYVLMIKRYTFINISINNISNISRWNIIYKFSYHLQLSCISNTIIIWIISNWKKTLSVKDTFLFVNNWQKHVFNQYVINFEKEAHNLVQNELSTGNVKDYFKTRTYFTISRFAVVILNRRHR